MSGIVGIVHLDGSSVNCELVHRLTDFLSFRGVDGRHTYIHGNVGFGHTLFKTTEECEPVSQPLTLDGATWIVADARVDARDELVAKLKSVGQRDVEPPGWNDAELILRAYNAWGDNCVEHLLGDFAFAIWDQSRQQLFCARDHMGVKPFYYAQVGSTVIFSNTLDCVRQHPLVSDRLNDLAIADFLLFSVNQDPATTSFHDIRRIPPAHFISWSADQISMRRYWMMPIDDPIFYKRSDDYTDEFHQLLRKCMNDRLRTPQVSVFMSGGIDSPTLAATARELLRERYAKFQLNAITDADSLVPDETIYAQMAASHLGIGISHRYRNPGRLNWEREAFSIPEPSPQACIISSDRRFWYEWANNSRVFFYGEGPDNALFLDWRPYLRYLADAANYKMIARSALAAVRAERRPPFWGRISRNLIRGAADEKSVYPQCLNRQLESRLHLRERWNALNCPPTSRHPIRPKAYVSFQLPLWQLLFESFDQGTTRSSFEVRHPFVDIRMLRFLLAVPALPWCRSKYLLRRAMRGKLPSKLLRRRKTTPDSRSTSGYLARFCCARFDPAAAVQDYLDVDRLASPANPADVESNLRARSLNHWLKNFTRRSHNPDEGTL